MSLNSRWMTSPRDGLRCSASPDLNETTRDDDRDRARDLAPLESGLDHRGPPEHPQFDWRRGSHPPRAQEARATPRQACPCSHPSTR
jgi:hypothetical protein